MTQPTEQDRQEFESWVSRSPYEYSIDRYPDSAAFPGTYKSIRVDLAWHAWQEAQAKMQARVAELEAICENVPEGCTPADARVLREANHAMVDEVARLNSLCESLNDTARHNFSVAVEIGEKLQSEKWHKDVAEAALLSVEKERDGLASKLKLVIDCGDSCCDEYCKDEWELAVNASADKAIAKLKADAVREALNKLAAEYAPEGLRATYTAFAVSQHISAQADYYASQIEREGGV